VSASLAFVRLDMIFARPGLAFAFPDLTPACSDSCLTGFGFASFALGVTARRDVLPVEEGSDVSVALELRRLESVVVMSLDEEGLEARRLEYVVVVSLGDEESVPDVEVLEPRTLEYVVVVSPGEEGFVSEVVVELEPRRLENQVRILLSGEEFVPGVEALEPKRFETRASMSWSREGIVPDADVELSETEGLEDGTVILLGDEGSVPLPERTDDWELQSDIAFDELPPEDVSTKLAPFV